MKKLIVIILAMVFLASTGYAAEGEAEALVQEFELTDGTKIRQTIKVPSRISKKVGSQRVEKLVLSHNKLVEGHNLLSDAHEETRDLVDKLALKVGSIDELIKQVKALESQFKEIKLTVGEGEPLSVEELQDIASGTGASRVRAFDHLVGNDLGALDRIDGDLIDGGDFSFTVDTARTLYIHLWLTTGSCSTNNSPNIVYPATCATDTNKGYWYLANKQWLGGSATPTENFDDSDDAGDIDMSIAGNCPTTNDCDIWIAVNSGADTQTIMWKIDTTDAGASTVQMGNPGTNYWQVDEAGELSNIGTAILNLIAASDLQIGSAAINFSHLDGAVADGQISAGAVDGGAGGEIADDTVDENDLTPTIETKLGYLDQSVLSASTPNFTGTNFSGIPSSAFIDNALIAFLNQTETITANWLFGTTNELQFRSSSQAIYSSVVDQLDVEAPNILMTGAFAIDTPIPGVLTPTFQMLDGAGVGSFYYITGTDVFRSDERWEFDLGIDIETSGTTIEEDGAGNISVEGNRVYAATGLDIPITDGGTGQSTAAAAASALGVGTEDSPQFTGIELNHALDNTLSASAGILSIEGVALAPLASPAFTGDPTAPTATSTDDDTSIATTAFVKDLKDVDQNIWQAITLSVGGLIADGTNCSDPDSEQINSGPNKWFSTCTDAAGTLEQSVLMPENWDGGNIYVELEAGSNQATPTGTVEFEIEVQSRGPGEVFNTTWIAASNLQFGSAIDTQYAPEMAESAVIAAAGVGGDDLNVRVTRDNDDGVNDTSTQEVEIWGAKIYYQIDDEDERD